MTLPVSDDRYKEPQAPKLRNTVCPPRNGAVGYYARQADIEPDSDDEARWDGSPFLTYSTAEGFNFSKQTAAGPGIVLLFDNRDNPNDASRGWYFTSEYRSYVKDFLGGDSTWENLYTDARFYRSLTPDRRHKLAFWAFGDFVTNGTAPYLSLPTTGGDPQGRSARGYAEGRFRGERLLYGEAEYRATVTRNGFLGVVTFLNVTTASNEQTGEELFESGAVGGGFGFRFLLHKRSRMNLCLDLGWGRQSSFGAYVGLADAF
jgi:outer membrane protein assembly factor BamA